MSPVSPVEAREQAAEYLGFAASVQIKADSGEVFEIPFPSLLDDDQQTRYNELQLSLESLDREPDLLNEDGTVKQRGEPLEPHRKDGKLVESYDVRLTKALFGKDGYERFRAAGGRSSDVSLQWWRMRQQLAERAAADSKSARGAGRVEAVPDAD